nr:DNA-directed DNA polymerase [Tanacetum cinerariifolium]
MPRECLAIIEIKSKVRYSRNKPVVAKVSTNTSTFGISPDVAKLKDMVKALLLYKKGQNQSPAPVKAVEKSCVTCRGAHSYRNYPATDGNVYRDNIQEFISQASAGNNVNQGPVYQPLDFQPPAYQAPAYQAPAPQIQGVSKEDFSAYVKANDAVMRNKQTQGQNMKNQLTNLTDLITKFVNGNSVSTSSSGTLPSNTIANPRSDLKAITTRSGVFYDGPKIPPSPSYLPKVVENEPEATKDTLNPTNNRNTEDVQPPVVQSKSPVLTSELVTSPISEPVIAPVKLADRLISRPVGVTEDVYVKAGSFDFLADFVVVDFDADPRVPLILERSFLKTRRSLIDVFEGELTLRVGKEAITFNLDQTSRYTTNYSDMTAKRIDVIDMACEDDFLLEEVDAFLAIEDDPTSSEFYQPYLDPEGDILLLEAFLNDDPSPPSNQGNYLLKVCKELKIYEAKSDKSSVDEPPEVKLKDLPPHLEYAFLEGDDKLPVIIAKDLSVEEKTSLITDFKPAVQHQRRVNPKIYDVIKQEVIKLLEAGLLYPISDSPWVSPVYCVPKKGGFTVIENKDNELIPTRLVTDWRICIDYRKLNEATQKDHFPLPFMDQMLERLGEKQYYCFLEGFSGYFQIPIDLKDQEKTTFTCPYETFAYRRMPFGLCNAPGTFQMCMMVIFHDMIEKIMEVFMDDFFVFGNSFQSCLSHLERILKRCEDTNLCLNWEKSHFMVKEAVSFMLTEAPILIALDWDMPFELMCDASDYAIGAVLGQRPDKYFRPIHYASKTMTEAESDYTITEKEMLAMVAVGENRASWSDKFDDALWAFRTAYKTPIECTPYKLVYEKACHLPVELEHKAY